MACGSLSGQNENETFTGVGSNCSGNTLYNGTYYLFSNDEGLYKVPTGIIILLSLFYGTISIAAVVGNSLVIWIIVTSRRMHNVTHYFIANLALADIVIGLFSIPFQFQAALLQRWNLPYFMCPFCPFIQILSVSVSIFTLTAIAVDRHRAVLSPLSARPSKLKAKIVIGVIWCLGAILGLPMALAQRVKILQDIDRSGRIHSRPFCENTNFSDSAMMYYRCILFLLQYVMPLCIISFAYVRMAHRLWDARAPGNAEDTRDANILKNKKKVIKMLVIVVTLFALCWLPLQTYNFIQEIIPEINDYRYINIIWFSFDWLAMSNSCYNPFIYGIYNERFRREFQIRFPAFRSKHVQSSPATMYSESIDLERATQSVMPSGMSVRMPHDAKNWHQKYCATSHGNKVKKLGSNRRQRHGLQVSRNYSRKNYLDLREMDSYTRRARCRVLNTDSEDLITDGITSKDDAANDTLISNKNSRSVFQPFYNSEEPLFRRNGDYNQAAFEIRRLDNGI